LDDLVKRAPDIEIVVDVTPDGQGDCIRTVAVIGDGKQKEMFVKPEQRTKTLSDFQNKLRCTKINHHERAMRNENQGGDLFDRDGQPVLPLSCTTASTNSTTDIPKETPDTSVYYYSRQVIVFVRAQIME
jgi:hypothetical protein